MHLTKKKTKHSYIYEQYVNDQFVSRDATIKPPINIKNKLIKTRLEIFVLKMTGKFSFKRTIARQLNNRSQKRMQYTTNINVLLFDTNKIECNTKLLVVQKKQINYKTSL